MMKSTRVRIIYLFGDFVSNNLPFEDYVYNNVLSRGGIGQKCCFLAIIFITPQCAHTLGNLSLLCILLVRRVETCARERFG